MSKEFCQTPDCRILKTCISEDWLSKIKATDGEEAVRDELKQVLGIAMQRNCPNNEALKKGTQTLIQNFHQVEPLQERPLPNVLPSRFSR